MEEHWTLAVYIWLPISIIITLVLIWVLNWGLQDGFKRGFRSAEGYGIAHWYSSLWTVVVAGALLALFVPLNLIGWIPYQKEYHQWQTHSGVVEQITQVQLGQDWVVKFEGDDNKYNCAETRCGTIRARWATRHLLRQEGGVGWH